MTTRARIVPGDGDPRHGTSNGYGNLYCRCPDCTEAWRVTHRRYMHADPQRLEMHAMRQRLYEKAKRSKG